MWNSLIWRCLQVEANEKGNKKFIQKFGKLGMMEDIYYMSEIKCSIFSMG
jgi:hypothetical protein